MNNKSYFMSVVKFNNEYFEHGDIISVITNDNKSFVGRLIMSEWGDSNFTCRDYIALDTSETFKQKRQFINYSNIKEIYKNK